jgi:hypothetical protein
MGPPAVYLSASSIFMQLATSPAAVPAETAGGAGGAGVPPETAGGAGGAGVPPETAGGAGGTGVPPETAGGEGCGGVAPGTAGGAGGAGVPPETAGGADVTRWTHWLRLDASFAGTRKREMTSVIEAAVLLTSV